MAENKDINKIREAFEGIRDERVKHANTARRIGNAFLSLLDYASSADNDKLSAIDDDTAHGLITFLKGIKIGKLFSFSKEGDIIAHSITADGFSEGGQKGFCLATKENGGYKLCIEEILAWGLATVGALHVKGTARFDDALGSPDFVSGFLDGKGWRLKNEPITNAAGVQENKYNLELDNLIVRGTMRIFEMIVSQLLGENDNRIFTAMLEVDHYDPESGKVYLDTREGRMYNPFRKDDYIMVQQYNGMPSSENNHYVTKRYELIVTEVGSEGSGEDMLAWVKFKNFTCSMEGTTPEQLITKRDTFVRVDNLSDPDRKGIIQMMTVGSDTPYMDIIYGLKTDPDNALKGRLGNLQGITHPLFGALSGFGEFLQNLYATGDFVLRRTGESIDTKIQMLQNQFATRFAQTSYEVTEDTNYLHNGQFLTVIGDTDGQLIDGWTIEDTDETQFWVDANGLPVMVNGAATVSGNHRVGIENNEGRNMLHILDSGITQSNDIIRKPGTHKEYTQPSAEEGEDGMKTTGDGYQDVQDTLYVSARIYAKTAGTLTFGFEGCKSVDGKTNDLSAQSFSVPYSAEWQTVELNGKWNGTGDFVLRYTGDLYISLLTVTDEPLDNLSKTVSTQILQTASNIKLLGQNIDKVNGTVTQLGIELDAEKKAIRLYVDEQDAALKKDYSSQIEITKGEILAEVIERDNALDTSLSSKIDIQAGRIDLVNTWQSETEDKISGIYTDIDSITASVESVTKTANGTKTALAQLEITVDGINSAVGKAATKGELVYAESTLRDEISENYKDVKQSIANAKDDAKDYADGIGDGIRNDYAATISLVQQTADSWSVAAGAFDADGHLIECSGMTVGTYFSNLFAKKISIDSDGNVTNISKSGLLVTADRTELESKISDAEGKIISRATIETMISDGISKATITADQIDINGVFTANKTFMIDTDGNMQAIGGTIGGFEIGTDHIGTARKTTSGTGGTDIGYGTQNLMSLYNDCIIFNGKDRQAIFGQWSSLGTPIMMRLFDDVQDLLSRTAAAISVRGSIDENVALTFGGGCVKGLNLKTFVSAFDYVTATSVPTRLNVNIDRGVGAAFVSTLFHWRSQAKDTNGKDVAYQDKTRDVYVYLPEMNHYDDGHIIHIKRGVNSSNSVYIVPGKAKNLVYKSYSSGIGGYYTTETANNFILYDANSYATSADPLRIASEGDAMTFIYFKNLVYSVTKNNVTTTYKGGWIQWKNPREW